jgi:hypothetical protein
MRKRQVCDPTPIQRSPTVPQDERRNPHAGRHRLGLKWKAEIQESCVQAIQSESQAIDIPVVPMCGTGSPRQVGPNDLDLMASTGKHGRAHLQRSGIVPDTEDFVVVRHQIIPTGCMKI